MGGWHVRHGRWWAVQWAATIGPVNLGVHMELRRRRTGREGLPYGPYVDVHLPFCVVSLGVNPVYAGDLDLLVSSSRGGRSGDRR